LFLVILSSALSLPSTSWALICLFAGLAIVPITLYNRQPGLKKQWVQYAFYALYPLHLLGLYWWVWV
jgi:hypothetical protein